MSAAPEVVRDAKRAVHDTSHPLYPLIPKGDQRALPEGNDDAILREPEMEPVVDLPADVQSPEELLQLVVSVKKCETPQGLLPCSEWVGLRRTASVGFVPRDAPRVLQLLLPGIMMGTLFAHWHLRCPK